MVPQEQRIWGTPTGASGSQVTLDTCDQAVGICGPCTSNVRPDREPGAAAWLCTRQVLAGLLCPIDMYHATPPIRLLSNSFPTLLAAPCVPAGQPELKWTEPCCMLVLPHMVAQAALCSPGVAPVMLSSLQLTAINHTQVIPGGLEPQIHRRQLQWQWQWVPHVCAAPVALQAVLLHGILWHTKLMRS